MPSPQPYRSLPIRMPQVQVTARDDGTWILESDYARPELERSLVHLFLDRAAQFPERAFVARREALAEGRWGDWRSLSYAATARQARALAQALIDLGCGPDASVMALSGPSLEHAVVMMAAHMARAPYAPISTGYSLNPGQFETLRHAFRTCRPQAIFADDGPLYEEALAALDLGGVHVVTVMPPRRIPALAYGDLLAAAPTPAVAASIDAIRPETHAKTIFTSGSTGMPKGVIHTHGMLTATVAQFEAIFIDDDTRSEPPPHLSWLPWSHLGGTNARFCAVIREGATLYIDEGRPVAGAVEESLRNLRELALADFNSPPAMFAFLVGAMERDSDFRDHFFSRLGHMTYGAASLSKDIFDRLQALAVAATGARIPVTTRYGTTEAQGITIAPWPLEATGPIGVPNSGVTVKLVPCGDLFELRVKGDCVTPGYLGDAETTAKAFDEEGFFCTGDAARLIDPAEPRKGLFFEGRVGENFKLSSGTWVAVGSLRGALIESLGIVRDCLVAGLDRSDVRVLAWLHHADAAVLAGLPETASPFEVASAPAVLAHLGERLAAYNRGAGGASRRVARLMLMIEAPIVGEITEKGYVNQAAALRRRAALVETLYASNDDAVVLEVPAGRVSA